MVDNKLLLAPLRQCRPPRLGVKTKRCSDTPAYRLMNTTNGGLSGYLHFMARISVGARHG
jgi:hypothetical protein